LYVCRAIVTAHGGHIWVERSAPVREAAGAAGGWHGTVMAVVLPLAAWPASSTLPDTVDWAVQPAAEDAVAAGR
jgi:hypothetical protein